MATIDKTRIPNSTVKETADGEIVAKNAHPVEYGQALFRIDPNG